MKKIAAFCLLASFIFSCSKTTTNQETETPTTVPADTSVRATETPVTGQKMPSAETKRFFSDPTNRDIFRLTLTGNSLIEAQAHFTIQNPEGKTIWQETFSAADLEASMVYEQEKPNPTLDERQKFIRERVKDFFDQKYFSTPAVAPNDNFDPAFGDQITWQAIKNDKNAVGFSYLLGKENGRRIAYSKLKNQVMQVGAFGG